MPKKTDKYTELIRDINFQVQILSKERKRLRIEVEEIDELIQSKNYKVEPYFKTVNGQEIGSFRIKDEGEREEHHSLQKKLDSKNKRIKKISKTIKRYNVDLQYYVRCRRRYYYNR